MSTLTRRDLFTASLATAAAIGVAHAADPSGSGSANRGPAFTDAHPVQPLPFDPKGLRGLSERLLVSHWENNYAGSVRALNLVRTRLRDALAIDDPPYLYNDIKREHALRTGSVVLHELYFGNLGGNGNPAAEVRSRLAAGFGSFDAWETEFRRIALGLGGGSGWVVLGFNEHLQMLENYWLADHASHPAATRPLLVLDMYEHSYHLDYGAAAARYVDAFMTNVNWETVAARLG